MSALGIEASDRIYVSDSSVALEGRDWAGGVFMHCYGNGSGEWRFRFEGFRVDTQVNFPRWDRYADGVIGTMVDSFRERLASGFYE